MTLVVLVLEDEVEVRHALERDLEVFWSKVHLEAAEDVPDAWDAVEATLEDGDELAVVLADHRLPGRSGVDFLVEIAGDPRTENARTVLVTGQAGQADTVRALNQAGLDHYIAKPWDPADLVQVVRDQLTTYVLENHVDPLPYLSVLDEIR
ncbi:MAG: response regulator, partial [Actinomyces sp.]|nr:response regulator [Actinomyces sp.]